MRLQSTATFQTAAERLIRLEEVISITGKARTQVYEAVKNRTFPVPIKEGRCSLWVESEVQSWVADRIARAPRKA